MVAPTAVTQGDVAGKDGKYPVPVHVFGVVQLNMFEPEFAVQAQFSGVTAPSLSQHIKKCAQES